MLKEQRLFLILHIEAGAFVSIRPYEALKIEGRIGCHGLRKTLGYHASKAKTPQAVLMEIYKHSSWAVTKRYLGITQDEIDAVYLKVPLF